MKKDSLTINGETIYRFDTRDGHDHLCECGVWSDDHAALNHEVRRAKSEDQCGGCGGDLDPGLHWGVYLNRVSYAMYCSVECAWKHDPTKYANPRYR